MKAMRAVQPPALIHHSVPHLKSAFRGLSASDRHRIRSFSGGRGCLERLHSRGRAFTWLLAVCLAACQELTAPGVDSGPAGLDAGLVDAGVDSGPAGLDAGLVDAGVDAGPCSPTFAWARGGTLEGTLQQAIRGVDVGADGAIVICGNLSGSRSIAGQPLTGAGGEDVFVMVLEPDATVRWARTFGAAGDDVAIDCDLAPSGAVVVTGLFQRRVTFGPGVSAVAVGAADAFTLLLTPDGTPSWVRTAGGAASDYGNEVAVDPAGNVLVALMYESDDFTFGGQAPVAVGHQGRNDALVVSYAPDGALRWWRSVAGDGDDLGRGVATDPAGNVIFVGETTSAVLQVQGTPVGTAAGGSDLFVTSWTHDGALRWAGRRGGPGDDAARAAGGGPDGVAFVGGKFTGSVDFGGLTRTSAAGSSDLFLVRLDATGAVDWVNTISSTSTEEGVELSVSRQGEVVVSGDFTSDVTLTGKSTALTLSAGAAQSEEFVAAWTLDGALLWALAGGGPGREVNYDVGVGPSGAVVLVGTSQGAATFGAHGLSPHDRVYVAAVAPCRP
jgi:hypothetical protein